MVQLDMHQVGFRRNDPCDGMRTLEATSIVAMRLANGELGSFPPQQLLIRHS